MVSTCVVVSCVDLVFPRTVWDTSICATGMHEMAFRSMAERQERMY